MKAKYNFSAISAGEAAGLYRDARDKKEQIGVLADLLCCTKADVRELLRDHGCTIATSKPKAKRKRVSWTPEEDEIIWDMFDSGATCAQICVTVERCEQSVRARLAHTGRYFRKRRTKQ